MVPYCNAQKPLYLGLQGSPHPKVSLIKRSKLLGWFNCCYAALRNYYDRFYRTYWFSKNSVSDTLILVEMLSPKQLSSIPNWQCEEQEVDIYNRLYKNKNKNNNNHPRSFTYNCSKGRFKVLGDPD